MEAVKRLLNESTTVTIVSHVHPDGDAIGSLLGLQLGLEQLGKEVHGVLRDPLPSVFSFLPHAKRPLSSVFPKVPGLCVVVDLSDAARTGFPDEIHTAGRSGSLVNIDHHPRGELTHLSAGVIHQEHVSSACELVYRLLTELEVRMTSSIATALLTGIYTDTGGFQYPNTSTDTLEIASELMRRGGRLDTITHNISRSKSVAGLKLLGLALERMRLTHGNQCAVSVITHKDIAECGASPEDLSGIIGEMNVLPQVKISMLLTEVEIGVIRGTLRTGEGHKNKVSTLAKILGGGGHPRAAGFIVPGNLVVDQQTNKWKVVSPS